MNCARASASWLVLCLVCGACTDLETAEPLDSGIASGMSGEGGTSEATGGVGGGSGGMNGGAGGGGGSGGTEAEASGGIGASGGDSGAGATSGDGGDSGSGGTSPDPDCSSAQRACADGRCVGASECCDDGDCPSGGSCEDGACVCPAATHACGDVCASDTAPESCGESCDPCEAPTGGGATCEAETCTPTCPENQRPCAGACLSNAMACTGQCPDGSHDCSGVCVPDTSVNGCGDSACTPCPVPMFGSATCDGTGCDFACETTRRKCDDACVPAGGCCEDSECTDGFTCVMGSCKSFCNQRVRPSGVAPSDYQCLDFDNSSALPWPTDVHSGTAAHATSPVFSLPGSFRSSYMPAASGAPRALLSWRAAGGTDISSMHVSMRIRPQLPPPVQPPYEGRMEAMCIESPGFKQCLAYTNLGTLLQVSGPDITSYTGWFIHTELSGGAFLIVQCPLTRNLTMDAWNTVEYDASEGGSITINGLDAGDCGGAARGTETTLTLGAAEHGGASHWTVHYDNIVVSVKR